MKNKSSVKNMTLTAVCIALCVVLPIAFHSIPDAGSVFLPMHIPVLICGMICGWPYGFICGLMGPLLSSALTGMPPIAILPAMMLECGTYGMVSGIMLKLVHTRSTYGDLYIALVTAMLAGRVMSGIAKALIFMPGISMTAWITAAALGCRMMSMIMESSSKVSGISTVLSTFTVAARTTSWAFFAIWISNAPVSTCQSWMVVFQ